MNENLNLTKILKDCPRGWKFWSPLFGEVEFERIFENIGFISVKVAEDGNGWGFNFDATFFLGDIKSKEIMLYPSKDQRDWSKFTAPWYKKEKFDPSTLKAYDRILVKNNGVWFPTFFVFYNEMDKVCICAAFGVYEYCIPYNDDTKYLIGTTDEAPEYYRYWED